MADISKSSSIVKKKKEMLIQQFITSRANARKREKKKNRFTSRAIIFHWTITIFLSVYTLYLHDKLLSNVIPEPISNNSIARAEIDPTISTKGNGPPLKIHGVNDELMDHDLNLELSTGGNSSSPVMKKNSISTASSSSINMTHVEKLRTIDDVWNLFDCDRILDNNPPIPSEAKWIGARELFRTKFSKSHDPSRGQYEVDADSFSVPVEVKYSSNREKGRGLYAMEDIPKGAVIWSGKHSIHFDSNGVDYRKFIASLEPDLICDVLQCSSVQDVSNSNSTQVEKIVVDLDDGCFVNAPWEKSDVESMGCDPEAAKLYDGGCNMHDFALRDIKAGDEILGFYDFALAWRDFAV